MSEKILDGETWRSVKIASGPFAGWYVTTSDLLASEWTWNNGELCSINRDCTHGPFSNEQEAWNFVDPGHYIVQTSSANVTSRRHSMSFGEYRNVAILHVDSDRESVSMISEHARGCRKVKYHWGKCYVGKTDRCAYQRALAEAEEICERLNAELTGRTNRREIEMKNRIESVADECVRFAADECGAPPNCAWPTHEPGNPITREQCLLPRQPLDGDYDELASQLGKPVKDLTDDELTAFERAYSIAVESAIDDLWETYRSTLYCVHDDQVREYIHASSDEEALDYAQEQADMAVDCGYDAWVVAVKQGDRRVGVVSASKGE